MQVLLRLFSTLETAADGSKIPRSTVEEYLSSDRYTQNIENRTSIGGITHKDRRVSSQYDGVVGPDDQVLISENYTHYISEVYLKGDDPICYGVVTVLDPNEYEGRRKENIINLMADLKSGIKLPVSIVVQGLWTYDDVCEKIISLKGVDFTLNPSFGSAGVVKVFSSNQGVSDDKLDARSFSIAGKDCNNLILKTVSYSASIEILPEGGSNGSNPTQLSLLEVKEKYGLFSDEYKIAKDSGLEFIDKESLRQNAGESKSFSDKDEIDDDYIKAVLLRSMGNNIKLVDDLMRTHKKQVLQVINSIPGVDGIPDEQVVTAKIDELLRSIPKVMQFSTINSIRDRMYFSKYPRYSLIKRLLHSYRDYYESKKDNISDYESQWLQNLLIQDVGILLKNVIPNIMKGSTLPTLYALIQFNQEVSDAGLELSNLYRQVLLSEKVLGFVPEKKYKQWKESLVKFLNAISKYVFGTQLVISVTAMDTLTKV